MTVSKTNPIFIEFEDNDIARNVSGINEKHFNFLRKTLQVKLKNRGDQVFIDGEKHQVLLAQKILKYLKHLAEQNYVIQEDDVSNIVKEYQDDINTNFDDLFQSQVIISSHKKKIYPRTKGQKDYVEAINNHDIVFGVGPAGTGKTYLAMAIGVAKLLNGEVERILLTRPAVEAGEKLGFLPGDLAEKVDPYLKPLYDALFDMVDRERAGRMVASGQIEVAPLAFMRGRTLNKSYVILDEAQNCTREQMKMFLTRLGLSSQAVVTGDITQIDLPHGTKSGLIQAIKILENVDGINVHLFSEKDVVRHPLVAKIINAYEKARRIP